MLYVVLLKLMKSCVSSNLACHLTFHPVVILLPSQESFVNSLIWQVASVILDREQNSFYAFI